MRGKITVCVAAVFMLALCIGCKNTKHAQQVAATTQQKASSVDTSDVFNEYYVHDTAAEAKASGGDNGVVFSPQGTSAWPAHNVRYVVQVACVSTRRQANRIVAKLGSHGLSAYVAKVENPVESMTGTFYRVRIGGFGSVAEAQVFGNNRLTEYGYGYWVDRKKHDTVGVGTPVD